MSYELSHDTIAKQVYEKASTEARTRRKVERFVHERHAAYTERGAALTQDDLDYVKPYRKAINISVAEEKFLADGQTQLERRRFWQRILVLGIIGILTTATIISWQQYRKATEQTEIAKEEERKAHESDLRAQERAKEAEQERNKAEASEKAATAAEARAVEEAEAAKRERAEAIRARRATQTALNETESFELAYRAGVAAEDGKYLEGLSLSWQSFLALPGKHSTDAVLNIAHPFEEWDLATSVERYRVESFDQLQFSDDGKYYFTGSYYGTDSIAVWRASDQLFLFKREVQGLRDKVLEDKYSICFSPDSKLLIAFDTDDGERKAWQVPSGRSVNIDEWPAFALYALSCARDIKATANDYHLLVGDGREMRVLSWESLMSSTASLEQDDIEKLFRTDEYAVTKLQIDRSADEYFPKGVFSPDGRELIMVEDDEDELARFDARTGERLPGKRNAEYSIDALAFPDHGRYIVACSESAALVYDPKLTQRIDSFQMTYPDYLSPKGDLFVEHDRNYLRAWNYDFIWSEQWLPNGEEFQNVVIGPQSGHLIYQLADHEVWIQEMRIGGSSRQLQNSDKDNNYFFFSSDEKFLLCKTTSQDYASYQLFKTANGKEIEGLDNYTALTFSPDAKYLFSCDTLGKIHRHPLNDISSAELIIDNGYPVESLHVGPNGRYLVTYNTYSGSTRGRMWNIDTQEKHAEFAIPTDPEACAFSPDGKYLYFAPIRGFDDAPDYIYTMEVETKKLGSLLANPNYRTVVTRRQQEPYLWPLLVDGQHYFMTRDGIWDVATGFQLESFKYQRGEKGDPPTQLIAVDPQARFTLQMKDGQINRYPTILPNLLNGNISPSSE